MSDPLVFGEVLGGMSDDVSLAGLVGRVLSSIVVFVNHSIVTQRQYI